MAEVMQPLARVGRVLSISRSDELCRRIGIGANVIDEADFPEHSMLSLRFPDQQYDFVASDQVLEHIAGNPFDAVKESFRVLKPGGIAVHTTCLIQPIHNYPTDMWRFTPDALGLLCQPHAEVIETGGSGHPVQWLVIGLGLRFEPVPDARGNLLHRLAMANHPNWPISTWVVARKRMS
ncbi:MAG: class I SAM-dependent methyltransferase [Candidatus Rokuibacteriota bacterium]